MLDILDFLISHYNSNIEQAVLSAMPKQSGKSLANKLEKENPNQQGIQEGGTTQNQYRLIMKVLIIVLYLSEAQKQLHAMAVRER